MQMELMISAVSFVFILFIFLFLAILKKLYLIVSDSSSGGRISLAWNVPITQVYAHGGPKASAGTIFIYINIKYPLSSVHLLFFSCIDCSRYLTHYLYRFHCLISFVIPSSCSPHLYYQISLILVINGFLGVFGDTSNLTNYPPVPKTMISSLGFQLREVNISCIL